MSKTPKTKGVIRPGEDKAFFIGWDPAIAGPNRRAMLGATLAIFAAGGGSAAALAALKRGPGEGSWDPGAVEDFSGVVVADPYPRLVSDAFSGADSALLVCPVKCGAPSPVLETLGAAVTLRGTLLKRGRDHMIAVNDDETGVKRDPNGNISDLAARQQAATVERDLGEATLSGEILDAKCWFGAMRPGSGKPHKACAALCIRMGIPPALLAKDSRGRNRVMTLTEADGSAMGEWVLPYVADPIEASGRIIARGDALQFRMDREAIVRRA